jgi:small GTP-binding protein
MDEYRPTNEDSYRKAVTIEGVNYVVNIIDTPGAEHNPGQTISLIRSADGFILVYDITNAQTFADVRELQAQVMDVKSSSHRAALILVGNKSDLESRRQVSEAQGRRLAEEWGCGFYESSAKNRVNHDHCFLTLVREIEARGHSIANEKCCCVQ